MMAEKETSSRPRGSSSSATLEIGPRLTQFSKSPEAEYRLSAVGHSGCKFRKTKKQSPKQLNLAKSKSHTRKRHLPTQTTISKIGSAPNPADCTRDWPGNFGDRVTNDLSAPVSSILLSKEFFLPLPHHEFGYRYGGGERPLPKYNFENQNHSRRRSHKATSHLMGLHLMR